MDIAEKVTCLDKTDIFASLSQSDLEAIAGITQEVHFGIHETIFDEGDTGDCAYVLMQGTVKVYKLTENGKEIPVKIMSKGEILGEMALLDGGTRSASAMALSPVGALKISAASFQRMLKDHHEITINLLFILSKKLRLSTDQLETVMTSNSVQRTWGILKTLAESYHNDVIPLTHEELSLLTGITRPRLTEALHALESEGKISLSDHTITLL